MGTENKIKYGLGVVIILALAAVVTGWWLNNFAREKKIVTEAPVVRTQAVSFTGSNDTYNYSGEVRGRYESHLAFQVGGKIIRRNIELGSSVKKGDVLLQIDPIDISQGVAVTKAQVMAAESQWKLTKDNLDRFKEVYNQKFMSKAELDRYLTMYDAAQAQLRQAKAQYNASANQYGYCNLTADQSGVVAGINVEVGQVVGPGQPVVTLVRDSEKEVEINVPENRLDEVRNSKQLLVKFWALPNLLLTGKVREVAPMASPLSQTYTMRVSLLNSAPELKLGMTATVMVNNAGQPGTVYVPLAAIYQTGNVPDVWIVKNDRTVQLRPVKIGEFGADRVQVTEGLGSGDIVVTAGVHKLREGQKVRLEEDQNE